MPHIGVWWHVTPMIALRPSLGIRNESQTTDNVGLGTSSETSSTVFQFGLSLPIYLAKFKALDLFVAPAFNFKSTSSKTTSGGTSTSSSASGFDLGASLGVQLPLHEQFHVFGEMGFGYAKDDSKKQTVVGLVRTSLGAIFYFN